METGLYYNRYRYYSPEEGMYVTAQDPIRLEGGDRLYAYVHDPNAWIDSSGLAHYLAAWFESGQFLNIGTNAKIDSRFGKIDVYAATNKHMSGHSEVHLINALQPYDLKGKTLFLQSARDGIDLENTFNPCRQPGGCTDKLAAFAKQKEMKIVYYYRRSGELFHDVFNSDGTLTKGNKGKYICN